MALEDKVRELAVANDLDQAGRFQLFNVMRQSRITYGVDLVQPRASHRMVQSPDVFEDLDAPRFSKYAPDSRELPVCQANFFGGCHRFNIHPVQRVGKNEPRLPAFRLEFSSQSLIAFNSGPLHRSTCRGEG